MAKSYGGFRERQVAFKGMYPNTAVQGFEEVLSNLQREAFNIENGSLKGLILAAAFIRRETERNSPITPVDLGNLRSSWFTVSSKGKAANVKDKFGTALRTGNFKGLKMAELSTEHEDAIAEAQRLVANPGEGTEMVMMGYSANYAVYVHENIGAHFQRPQAGAKWFEAAMKRSTWQVLKILKDNTQIKK
jgi:hypothetical protein